MRGFANKELGKTDNAINDFSMAIRYNPSDVESYNARADIYIEMKKIAEAINDLNHAVKINPG